MNENLLIYPFQQHKVRVVMRDGEPWFVVVDVCAVLGLSNPTVAVERLDNDEVSTLSSTEGGGDRNIVSESGLYDLILGSRKPEAREFKRWVRKEVLPSIRKTGRYEITPSAPTVFADRALEDLNDKFDGLAWQQVNLFEQVKHDLQVVQTQNAQIIQFQRHHSDQVALLVAAPSPVSTLRGKPLERRTTTHTKRIVKQGSKFEINQRNSKLFT